MNPKRLRKRIRGCDHAIRLPRKLKKLLKKQNAGGWPSKDIRITFYGWVGYTDEFGGYSYKEVGLFIPKSYPRQGAHLVRLSARQAEWNKWKNRIGKYKYPLIPSLSVTPRFYYGTPRGRSLSLRTRRRVGIELQRTDG